MLAQATLDPSKRNQATITVRPDEVVWLVIGDLRKVEPGAADRSYGIEVARLAALPMSVIVRARQILALHESAEHTVTEELSPNPGPVQIQLFDAAPPHIVDRIRTVNIDELRPIEALQLLHELQTELKK